MAVENESNGKDQHSDSDDDITDVQDWSHIAKLTRKQAIIPKRGEKDYEPDGTDVQEFLLFQARQEMFDTLLNAARGSVKKNTINGYYEQTTHQAFIPFPRGNFMHTMGQVDRTGVCWLEFNEFVYLSERGTVRPFLKCGDDFDLPLSVQDLYAYFRSSEELDNYAVYAHLKRLGFIVTSSRHRPRIGCSENTNSTRTSWISKSFNCINRLFTNLFNVPFYSPFFYKILRFTSSGQLYLQLSKLVPYYSAQKFASLSSVHEHVPIKSERQVKEWHITFDVWKPKAGFKKKTPGVPDFQVIVFNKNASSQRFPTYREFRYLFRKLESKSDATSEREDSKWGRIVGKLKAFFNRGYWPGEPSSECKEKEAKPSKKVTQIQRLKKGYKSFIMAVMDDGLISYIRLSENEFGSESVWYDGARMQNKRSKRKNAKPTKMTN
ncbi:LAMI_0E07558g1_1 [Lachancea mirantina]|uniref:LAMI_0E07558g1_1 n=1 Tax=Lachancea mirantina TaxID=1230905 RepID=A0A1G4JN23_9SACH|nr:LAMI_0E07558g1_1 [Lachancea mirantina]